MILLFFVSYFKNFTTFLPLTPLTPSAMDTASAEIEMIDRRLVVGPARHRSHEQELVEHELTVVEIAFRQTIRFIEILGCDGFHPWYQGF